MNYQHLIWDPHFRLIGQPFGQEIFGTRSHAPVCFDSELEAWMAIRQARLGSGQKGPLWKVVQQKK